MPSPLYSLGGWEFKTSLTNMHKTRLYKKYNDNDLVVQQFGLLFEWLEAQAEGAKT